MATHQEEKAPRWIHQVLVGCFLYYFISGLWLVSQPNKIFELAGIAAPNYPWLVQFAGLLTVIFGLIFLPAASAPRRFFPCILIGLCAQIAVPVFTLLCYLEAQIPGIAAVPMVAVDLLWAGLLIGVTCRVQSEG